MSTKFTKGVTTITLLAAITGSGIVSWNAIETISQGKDIVKNGEWQTQTDLKLAAYQLQQAEAQKEAQEKFEKLVEQVVQLRVDAGTSVEILKIIGDRNNINTPAVEKRVTKEVASSTEEITK